jgi:hypothetical protein
LTEAEQRIASQAEWDSGRNWMLFTPSDLLKSYLKEALNKELLPADDEHVKVYTTFSQHDVARDSLSRRDKWLLPRCRERR